MNPELKDIIVAASALVGMALGIYNLIRAHYADRVRLRVIPKSASLRGHDDQGRDFYVCNRDHYDLNHSTRPDSLAIEIINISKFDVTVDDVGLETAWSRKRIVLATPILMNGESWPRKLGPRENVTVRFDTIKLLGSERIEGVRRAYASTVCGTTCHGRSGALRQFVRIARGYRRHLNHVQQTSAPE